MSDAFTGEIRMVGFRFAPRLWAACDGQLYSVTQNRTLYWLIGNAFGGQADATFNLPDFRDRVPIHASARRAVGETGGAARHVLNDNELPRHAHPVNAAALGGTSIIADKCLLADTPSPAYHAPTNLVPLASTTISTTGGDQGHENMQPYTGIMFCICMSGDVPPRAAGEGGDAS